MWQWLFYGGEQDTAVTTNFQSILIWMIISSDTANWPQVYITELYINSNKSHIQPISLVSLVQ